MPEVRRTEIPIAQRERGAIEDRNWKNEIREKAMVLSKQPTQHNEALTTRGLTIQNEPLEGFMWPNCFNHFWIQVAVSRRFQK